MRNSDKDSKIIAFAGILIAVARIDGKSGGNLFTSSQKSFLESIFTENIVEIATEAVEMLKHLKTNRGIIEHCDEIFDLDEKLVIFANIYDLVTFDKLRLSAKETDLLGSILNIFDIKAEDRDMIVHSIVIKNRRLLF